jgi:peptidyl-Lys metalloendopeptidase
MPRISCAPCIAAGLLMFVSSGAIAQIDGVGGESLNVQLRPAENKAAFKGAEPISIEFVLSNPSSQPVQVLKWRTPFDAGGVTENIFAVSGTRTGPSSDGGGGQVGYIGPVIKRGPPQADDFITLAPGQSRTATVNLAQYYAIYQQGDYSVAYRPAPPATVTPISQSPTPMSGPPLRKIATVSNAVAFSVTEARQPAPKLAPTPLTTPGSALTFDSCDANQQGDLQKAVPEARRIAEEAMKVLLGTPPAQQPNSARYKEWYGAHTAARYGKVLDHYAKITDSFATKQIEIACKGQSCSASTFAYVFPGQPYKIYVCGAFWAANLVGTDSRSGTLVHEMSHFDIVADTDDVVYGQAGARDLAKQNPDRATTNADTHEYFAENEPNLPM